MVNESSAKGFNYFFGLVNLVVVFCIVWLLWYIFMNPDAVFKLYTPMYGFALVVVFISSIILMTNVIGYPAIFERQMANPNPVKKGLILTLFAFILMVLINYMLFWGFIGKFGIAYFSPDSIVAGGGLDEPFMARENASIAILYYFTAFLWIALFWNLGFGQWPWQQNNRGTQIASKIFAIFFIVTLIYVVLFHSHVCYLFYPAQSKAGVAPWWEAMAGTGSAFFGLGIVLCTLVWIIFSDLLWEGHPWKALEKDGSANFGKGFITFIVTLTFGFLLLYLMLNIFDYVWDEAFLGGQYTDGPDWRFIHAGEISGFIILAAFILKNYFNNFPNTNNLWARCIIRSLIAVTGGMLIYWFYYSPLSTFFLAKVEGIAQPDDKPMVWTLLFLSIVLIQSEFFNGWPLRKKQS